jgi:hypothetical protein
MKKACVKFAETQMIILICNLIKIYKKRTYLHY